MWPFLDFAGLHFPTYNLTLAVGILVGLGILFFSARRNRVALRFLADNFLILFVITIVFARLVEVWLNDYPFTSIPFFWQENGGFSFYGGMIGFLLALWWLCRKYSESFLTWLDLLTLSATSVLIFHHVGAFFSGAAYGIPTVLPWGITFTNPEAAVLTTLPIHPIQLYAAILTALFFAIGIYISNKTRVAGKVGIFLMLTLSISYFFLGFLRGDSAPMFGILRANQYFSLAFITLSASLVYKTKYEKHSARNNELNI